MIDPQDMILHKIADHSSYSDAVIADLRAKLAAAEALLREVVPVIRAASLTHQIAIRSDWLRRVKKVLEPASHSLFRDKTDEHDAKKDGAP